MNEGAALGILAAAGAVVVLILIAVFVIHVFFLLSLQKALTRCDRRNRTMEPGLVWLSMIPLFHWAWIIRSVVGVGDSLKNEFADRDMDNGGDYGKTIGVWMELTAIFSTLISWSGQAAQTGATSFISGPLSIASLVLFIIYWVRLAGYSRQLQYDDEHAGNRYEDEMDDDYDDRPRSPRSPRPPMRPDERIR